MLLPFAKVDAWYGHLATLNAWIFVYFADILLLPSSLGFEWKRCPSCCCLQSLFIYIYENF